MTTVVLVDDHPIVRQGIRLLLQEQANFHVVGETDQGTLAVELVERLQPDLAIVDLMLPDLNGMEVTRRIVRVSPRTRVVALSMYEDESHVLDALRAGAMAYIIKGASSENLLYGISEALAGRRYLSPPLSDRAIAVYSSQVGAAADSVDAYLVLTPRERDVLQLLALGYTYAEIAERLVISPRTAETHRTNIMRKLNLTSQADITFYAIKRGLIASEQGKET
jgi:two-component system response regulator NreC